MDEIFTQLSIESLKRGRYQPRREFSFPELKELSESILADGIIQPITVRPIENKSYEIIAGERRWRAAQLAKLDKVPCIIREISDEQAATLSLVENIQRKDLNPLEEAWSYQQFHDEFKLNDEEIARRVGKSRSVITHARRLLTLELSVQDLIKQDQLQAGHGKVLVALLPAEQVKLAKQAAQGSWSVRQLENAVKQARKQRRTGEYSEGADLVVLERALSSYLGSPVQVEDQQGKGHLKISYNNLEIFEGILEKMGFAFDKL